MYVTADSQKISQRDIHCRNNRVIPIKLDTQRTKHLRVTFADCQPNTVNEPGSLLRQQYTAVSRHDSAESTSFCTFIGLSCRSLGTGRIFKTCPPRFMAFRHFPYLGMAQKTNENKTDIRTILFIFLYLWHLYYFPL